MIGEIRHCSPVEVRPGAARDLRKYLEAAKEGDLLGIRDIQMRWAPPLTLLWVDGFGVKVSETAARVLSDRGAVTRGASVRPSRRGIDLVDLTPLSRSVGMACLPLGQFHSGRFNDENS